MNQFLLNGDLWRIRVVDPGSPMLVDRTGTKTVATTDPRTKCVYLSGEIHGEFLFRVLIHELGHCAMISFDLLRDIRRLARPEHWIEAEEWVCNFLADYGMAIFRIAFQWLGYDAWRIIPEELENMIA